MSGYYESYKRYIIRERFPNPDRATLLVIDMQRYFSDIASSILENINHLISNCRKKGIPIIFTRYGHINPAEDAGMLFEWWSNGIIEGTEAHGFMDGLLKEPDDMVIKKMRYSAFHQTDLNQILALSFSKDF